MQSSGRWGDQEFKTDLDYTHNAMEAGLDYTSDPA